MVADANPGEVAAASDIVYRTLVTVDDAEQVDGIILGLFGLRRLRAAP